MSQIYTTGNWTPKTGREAEFVAAWHEFAPNRRHHDFRRRRRLLLQDKKC